VPHLRHFRLINPLLLIYIQRWSPDSMFSLRNPCGSASLRLVGVESLLPPGHRDVEATLKIKLGPLHSTTNLTTQVTIQYSI